MDDQFPGRIKARLGRLVLPELEVERPVKLGQLAMSFDKPRSHHFARLPLQGSNILRLWLSQ
jgi:hypothetical protein